MLPSKKQSTESGTKEKEKMEKEEFKKMIETGKDNYKIILIDGNNYPNEKYNSYWAIVSAGDKFYYIEYSIDHFMNDQSDITITLYNKINANAKRQAEYTKNVENIKDIIKYINDTKNKTFRHLPGTYNQTIFYELKTIVNGKTIEQYLKDISGYREKEILNNLKYITKENNTDEKNYNILKLEDEEGNFFKINTKNIEKLIIG